jgi:tRNA1Val (adenine37-N6)-methyltransferase
MKVGTDGVLLGAWANCCRDAYLRPFWANCCRDAYLRPFGSRQSAVGSSRMLDIGTGTGLIALMLAQRFRDARITAVEMDEAAAIQAGENIASSLWSDRIELLLADFRIWMPPADRKFDLVVCNPPFFTRSLKNPDIQKATARHDDELPLVQLIPKSAGFLSPVGKLAIILPFDRFQEAMVLARENGLFLSRRLDIRGNPLAPAKRILLEWGRQDRTAEMAELVIESGGRGVYTEDYKRLTGEFYLD